MEKCIVDIRKWMADNFLQLNDDKTEVLLISSKHYPAPSFDHLTIGQSEVATTKSARNIGVTFDTNMTLKPHIQNTTSQAFFHIRNIGSIRKYLTQQSAETLVHAFVTTKLDYCNSLLYGLPSSHVQKLQYVQNTAARVVTLTKKFDHISPVLASLHWLPIQQRIQFKILLFVFKIFHGLAPQYLAELITPYHPLRNLRSANQMLLNVPSRPRTHTYGDRPFSQCAPMLWNRLPDFIRTSSSIGVFKSHLKTHLFKS